MNFQSAKRMKDAIRWHYPLKPTHKEPHEMWRGEPLGHTGMPCESHLMIRHSDVSVS